MDDLAWPGGKKDVEALARHLVDRIDAAYQLKEKAEEPQAIRWLERQIMLQGIDALWQEHLYNMDMLRHSIQLRAYGQRDPLVEYKQEAFQMFERLTGEIKDRILGNMFRSATNVQAFQHLLAMLPVQEQHEILSQFAGLTPRRPQAQPELPRAEIAVSPEADVAEEPLPEAARRQPGAVSQSFSLGSGVTLRRELPKIGRNTDCPCGSGKKFKQCCGA
jgi:preprotein translocase subunit SecA